MEVDLVYLWVNGNDPVWAAKRDAYIGCTTATQANCKGRYVDSGDLKYSLRSVEKYAPWIRKIFIVTDNQVPEWLDTSNPRVTIVDHTEIMPAECLPCFNSSLIEQFLHLIPGLSEHFLYANDDMYINMPVSPQNFFGPEGLPMVFLQRKRFRKHFLAFREKVLRKQLNTNAQTIRNAALLVEREYGTYYGGKLHHNIDPYRKSIFAQVNERFATELAATRSHHMRSRQDIQRCIYSYVALAEKQGHLRYVDKKHSFHLQIENRKLYKEFEKCQPLFFCMNDTERATDDDRRFAIQYVSQLFPEKSQFEKDSLC